jgi:hypothetical protein
LLLSLIGTKSAADSSIRFQSRRRWPYDYGLSRHRLHDHLVDRNQAVSRCEWLKARVALLEDENGLQRGAMH